MISGSLLSCMIFSRNPYSLNWAYPICPLKRLDISIYFLARSLFFSYSICFLISWTRRSYSSCFLLSIIIWNSLVKFYGPFNLLDIDTFDNLLFFTMDDSSMSLFTFLLNSSECSICSSLSFLVGTDEIL